MAMKTGDAVITGTVTGPDGAPIEGATVSARRPDETTPAGSSATDASGRYRIDGLKPRTKYLLTVDVLDGHQEVEQVTTRKGDQIVDISLPTEGGPMSDTTTTTTTDSTTSDSTTSDSTTSDSTTSDSTTTTTSSDSTTTTSDSSTTVSDSTTATDSSTTTVAPSGNDGRLGGLLALIESPEFAPEPAVNVPEARLVAHLWVLGMFELAGVPAAVNRFFDGDLPDQSGDSRSSGWASCPQTCRPG